MTYFDAIDGANDLIRLTTRILFEVLGDYALPYTERIFQHLLGCSRTELYLYGNRKIDSFVKGRLSSIVSRCLEHEPLDYILGESYFFNREFNVNPDVLIPRPDTETLIEVVLNTEDDGERFFLDLGTGSGIIACILTEQRKHWVGIGVDISEKALSVARRNLRNSRVRLVCADLLSAFSGEETFDFIVSNPPYISASEIANLDESVRRFEPLAALYGGADGLDFYRRIAINAPAYLKSDGRLYCEISYNQEDAVKTVFSGKPWKAFRCRRDLAGNPRVVIVQKEGRMDC